MIDLTTGASRRTETLEFIPLDYSLAEIKALQPYDGEVFAIFNTPGYGGQRIQLVGEPYNTTRNKTIQELYTQWAALQGQTASSVAAGLANHIADQSAHGATFTPTANKIAKFNASGGLNSGKVPTAATDVVRKQELDTKQDNKPNGADFLIGSDQKINPKYISVTGSLTFGGTFNGTGIITASTRAAALNGVKIDTVPLAQWEGFFFIANATYTFGGYTYTVGDWAVDNGTKFVEIDNGNAVNSVAGLQGVITAAQLRGALSINNVENTRDLDKPISNAQQNVNNDFQDRFDEIPNVYAPIDSPILSGIPESPIPDLETAPDTQIETVKNTRDIWDILNGLLNGNARFSDNGDVIRTGDNGPMRKADMSVF